MYHIVQPSEPPDCVVNVNEMYINEFIGAKKIGFTQTPHPLLESHAARVSLGLLTTRGYVPPGWGFDIVEKDRQRRGGMGLQETNPKLDVQRP